MPKNQQGKPNGFILHAQEIKNELLREGHSIKTIPDLIAAAGPKWQALPEDEKEYYKEKAKWEWENRNVSNKYKKKNLRRDCTGAVISHRVDAAAVNEARRKSEREEVFNSFPKGRAVLEKKFYFLSFICLLEEPEYQAVEVAAVQFSLLHGIEKYWHKFINPGPIPVGYRFKAQSTSENTHKIPCEGISRPEDTWARVYDELFQFLSQGTNLLPPIHVKKSETERVEGCIKWLANKAGRQNQLHRIYELEGLILDLDSHLNDELQNFAQNTSVATNLISSTIFDWDDGTRCKWHEENESKYCALGNIKRYCFCIANHFCELYDIQVTPRHLPVTNNDVGYTLIPSNIRKSRTPSNYASRAVSRGEASSGSHAHSEDIAGKVAQQLKIEAQNRAEEEEQQQHQERERKHQEEQQKRRWDAIRGAGNSSNGDVTPTNKQETAVPCTTPIVSKVVKQPTGRGSGRGLLKRELRRPGESRSVSNHLSHQQSVPQQTRDSIVKSTPTFVGGPILTGLGRGVNKFAADRSQATMAFNSNDKLFAGLPPSPTASGAPSTSK